MVMVLARGLRTEDGGPPFGPDPELTLSDGTHAMGIVNRISDGPVPLLAVYGGRVARSSADGWRSTGDGNSDVYITTRFQRWNICDLCDSKDSDWDDPCALAGAACVEYYGFDVLEGMDLVVHRHGRIQESLDIRQDCQMNVTPVCQTVSYAMKDEWNVSDSDSLTMTADGNDPDMNDFCQRVVSSDNKNCLNSDNGSATDLDGLR